MRERAWTNQSGMCRSYLSLRADLRSEREQRFICLALGSELHAAMGTGNANGGYSSQAERGCVAEKAGASLAMVGAGREARHGNRRQQNQFVRREQVVYSRAETCVPFAQRGDFIGFQTCPPFQAITNGWFKTIVVASMQSCRFRCLNGAKISMESAHQLVSTHRAASPKFSSSRIMPRKLS